MNWDIHKSGVDKVTLKAWIYLPCSMLKLSLEHSSPLTGIVIYLLFEKRLLATLSGNIISKQPYTYSSLSRSII